MSGWVGFSTAVSGLLASQKSLYTTNHNISNANTEGYSRQETVQKAASALNLPGIGMLGAGTEITEINRVRDSYTNFKFWNENCSVGEWEIKRDSLVEIENLFNEPSESSIRKNMDEFFSALETLSSNPSSYAHRSLVREKAVALTTYLNETSKELCNMQKELNFSVGTKIKQVNDIAGQIKNLNKEIYRLELDTTKANDLRDRREVLVDKLSKIVDAQVNEVEGKYRVSISGISLVDHVSVSEIKYPPSMETSPIDSKENIYKVVWDSSEEEVNLRSGELKGLLESRDGDGEGNNYRGIPYYVNRLNQFAKKIAEKFNEVHSQGHGLNENTGTFFFTSEGNKTSNYADLNELIEDVNASNISLSGDILLDLDKIAAASSQNGVENNENLLELIDLRNDKTFFDGTDIPKGTPDDFAKSIVSTLSVDSQQAARMYDNQEAILKNIEIRRESESGVSIDEEMSDMVKFQHSYNAAARMITTIDELYDVTINRLGLVGR